MEGARRGGAREGIPLPTAEAKPPVRPDPIPMDQGVGDHYVPPPASKNTSELRNRNGREFLDEIQRKNPNWALLSHLADVSSFEGFDVNMANANGFTPLMFAAEIGHIAAVNALLNATGIDVNKAHPNGITALMFAAQNGHTAALKELLKAKGIDVNKAKSNGFTALMLAALNGHAAAIEALLTAEGISVVKANPNGLTPLMIAAENGHAAAVEALLRAPGIDVNKATTDKGFTPLMMAAQNGHAAAVEALLRAPGIVVDKATIRGVTPLMIAAYHGHTGVIEALARASADFNAQNKEGEKAKEYATTDGVRNALARGERLQAERRYGILAPGAESLFSVLPLEIRSRTADFIDGKQGDSDAFGQLMYAARNGNTAALEALLKTPGIDVNKAITGSGVTPLMIAAEGGHTAALEALLRAPDIDVNKAITGNGFTALMFASRNGHTAAVKELLKAPKVDVNKGTPYGVTPLMMAAYNGHTGVIEALARASVDLTAKDKEGKTAKAYAKTDVVKNALEQVERLQAERRSRILVPPNESLFSKLPLKARQITADFVDGRQGDSGAQSVPPQASKLTSDLRNKIGRDFLDEIQSKNPNWELLSRLAAASSFEDVDVNKANQNGFTPLMFAAEIGHTAAVEALLNATGIDINKAHPNGITALMFAAQNGHTAALKELLKAKDIDVNKALPDGFTAIMLATENGHTGVIEALARASADFNAKDKRGETAKAYAKTDAVKSALEQGERQQAERRSGILAPGAESLFSRLPLEARQMTAEFVDGRQGDSGGQSVPPPASKVTSDLRNKNGRDFLDEIQSKNPNWELLSRLAAASSFEDVDVNKANQNGFTPLMRAAQKGHTAAVEALLNATGIDVNKAHPNGITALMFAAQNGHTATVEALCKAKGIDVNKADPNGFTALMIAAENGHTPTVEALLKATGINVNKATTGKGNTPLMIAVQNRRMGAVKALLRAKNIDPSIANRYGETPLTFATKMGYTDVVQALYKTWRVTASELEVPQGETLQALEAGILAFLKDNLQKSDFRKKDKTPLNDDDVIQLSKALARGFFSDPARLRGGQSYPLHLHKPGAIPEEIMSPVSLAITKREGSKAKIELFGQERGSGYAKEVKQRRKVTVDLREGLTSLKLGKEKVLLRAKEGKSDEMRAGQAKLRMALAKMKERGIALDEGSGFRIAGNIKDRPPRNGRQEGTELEHGTNLWALRNDLTLQQKMQALSDVAKTIKKFHEAGYTHGDIKPQNILLSKGVNPRGYLTDFDSLAKEGSNTSMYTKGYQDSLGNGSDASMQTRYTDIFAIAKSLMRLNVNLDFFEALKPDQPELPKAVRESLEALLMALEKVQKADDENAQLTFEQRLAFKTQLQSSEERLHRAISSFDQMRPEFKAFLDLLANFSWQD